MKSIRQLYLNHRVFIALFLVAMVYILAFFFSFFLVVAHVFLVVLCLVLVVDVALLFIRKKGVSAERILPEKLSNGDKNSIAINLKNLYYFSIKMEIIDEIPFQFQKRNFNIKKRLKAGSSSSLEYDLNPNERGVYHFGALNLYVRSPLGFVSRRFSFQKGAHLPSYPSFIHLRTYELMALQNEFLLGGVKKIRKLGHTMEFEQIKEYVQGDDIRSINWKATSKRAQLMVNQFQDEKSQRIYMLIDKGRTMQMPFNGLSLLDYSINATMALSHIILKKHDKAGMMTFSKKTENKISAEGKAGQLKKIADALYSIQTNFYESDFGRLYQDLKQSITQRSLILLFTNFETLDAVNRQMKYLRGIAKNHMLVVVFFRNSEMKQLVHKKPETLNEVYDEIIAEKFEYEKMLIIQELKKYGIHSIYTSPEHLNIEVINKYLEIKARGLL